MAKKTKTIVDKISRIESQIRNRLVEREEEIHGFIVSILADTNILLVGRPGIAKSSLASIWTSHFVDAKKFEYLLTKFTKEEEIFGPFSLKELRDNDLYKRNTQNHLPSANIAHFDEVFRANSPILNGFLTAFNERKVYDNGVPYKIPLYTAVGTTNFIPEQSDELEAIYDRFVLKYHVKDVKEKGNLRDMMNTYVSELTKTPKQETINLEDLDILISRAKNVKISEGIFKTVISIKEYLEDNYNIQISARTINISLRILQAEAILNNRDEVSLQDLAMLKHAYWKDTDDIENVRTAITSFIDVDENTLDQYAKQAEELYKRYKTELRGAIFEGDNLITAVDLVKDLREIKDKLDDMHEKRKNDADLDEAKSERVLRNVIGYIKEISVQTEDYALSLEDEETDEDS